MKQVPKRRRNTETASEIAAKFGVSPAYVRMVINGERENESILTAAIVYMEGKNELLEEIDKLVPFRTKKAI